jgi:phage terminase large subunit
MCLPIFNSENVQVDVEWKIDNIKFKEDRDGYITLHELPLTQKDKDGNELKRAPYVIGGDTAGSGEDYFTAKVICNLDGRTVATLRKQHIDEDLYAEQMYCLGKYYHDALIGVENNYSRHPTRVLSQKYSYPNLYVRQKISGAADVPESDYGFLTTTKTKPIIISELVEIMRDSPSLEVDRQTLKEMLTFVKKDNGAQEAIDGAHDDLVMALAITHFISAQQTHQWIDVVPEINDFLEKHFSVKHTNGNEEYINWEDI